MTNNFDFWAARFRDQYHDEIQREIKKHIRVLTKKARKKITRGKYDKVGRILAQLEYLNKCMDQASDVAWTKKYLKICLEQHYMIEDYPDSTTWDKFLEEHEKNIEDALQTAKSLLIIKLTCS